MLAAEEGHTSIAGLTLAILLLGSSVIFALGYAVAVVRRANIDYKKTKASLPGLRKDFWRTWRAAVKVGFWIAVAFTVLVVWTVNDFRDASADPQPSATVPARTK